VSPSGTVHGHRAADSAGIGWAVGTARAGRHLADQPFAGDDGSAVPAVEAALAALAQARSPADADAGAARPDPGALLRAQAGVVAALAGTRLLVPIVAVLGEGSEAVAAEGDKNADMALVTLTGRRDGRKALPAFTSVATCAAWDAKARPVPVEAERAALAAVAEGCDVVVLDPAGPVTCLVGRPAVWALGQNRSWTPAPFDDAVRAAVAEAATGVPGVVSAVCEPGRSAETAVVVEVVPGLTRDEIDDLARAVGDRLAASDVVADRVESVELRLVSA